MKDSITIVEHDPKALTTLRLALSALGYQVSEDPTEQAARPEPDNPIVFRSDQDPENTQPWALEQQPAHHDIESHEGRRDSQLQTSIIEPPRVTSSVA